MKTGSNSPISAPIELPALPEGYMWKVKNEYFGDRRHWSTTVTLHEVKGNGIVEDPIAWQRVLNEAMWGEPASFEAIRIEAEKIMQRPEIQNTLVQDDEKCKNCNHAQSDPLKFNVNRNLDFVQWHHAD